MLRIFGNLRKQNFRNMKKVTFWRHPQFVYPPDITFEEVEKGEMGAMWIRGGKWETQERLW
jgi:hypothetical protein